jgi:hypothetical protein
MYKFRTSTSLVAARILRALAVRLHTNRAALLSVEHISGIYNKMANVVSRRHSLDHTIFLTTFSAMFPPLQGEFWTMFLLSNKITSQKSLRNCSESNQLWSRVRFWKAWTHFVAIYFPNYDEKLRTLSQPEKINVLVCFAQHVRSGGVSRCKQHVLAQTVQVSLQAITARFEQDGEQNPVVHSQGKYYKKIVQLIEGYRRNNPPPKFQLTVPLTVPAFMHTYSRSGTTKQKVVEDMALIAFYFLLRVGEYTSAAKTAKKLTQAFRIQDVTLWDNNTILDHSLPLDALLTCCTTATLRISSQKNGTQNQAIHHEATSSDTCPAKALI